MHSACVTSQTQYQQPGQNRNLGLSNGVEEGNYIAASPSGMGTCSQEMVPKIGSKRYLTDRRAGTLRDFTSYLRVQSLPIFPWFPAPPRNLLSSRFLVCQATGTTKGGSNGQRLLTQGDHRGLDPSADRQRRPTSATYYSCLAL